MSIPHREGTTIAAALEGIERLIVSIPHREGTTTAFMPFVTAIISQAHHFCNIFLKKVGRSPFSKVRFLPILSHFLKIVIWALRSTDFLPRAARPSFQSLLFLPGIKKIQKNPLIQDYINAAQKAVRKIFFRLQFAPCWPII